MDLPKFAALLTSQALWLTNAEVLASDDPHEGTLSTQQFAHRKWSKADEVPSHIMESIVRHYSQEGEDSPASAFRSFMMEQEQICIYTQQWRRNYYVSCWHAADHESVAMWKIYGSPGPGLALISNEVRLSDALSSSSQELHLGMVRYFDERREQIDWTNAFNTIMSKRKSFSYEKECRIVYWDTADIHDPVAFDSWNDETMRFEKIVENTALVSPGLEVACNLDSMIASVMISPFAPDWYDSMIERLRDKFNFKFPVYRSKILSPPARVS